MSFQSKESLATYSQIESVVHDISASSLSAPQNAIVDLTLEDPLVAHYSFDDQSNVGENTHNPGVYDGTVTGTISGDGIYGVGREYTATTDAIRVTLPSNSHGDPFSFCVWAYKDTQVGTFNHLVTIRDTNSGNYTPLQVYFYSTEVHIYSGNSTNTAWAFSDLVTLTQSELLGEWFHFTATYDGDKMRIYVNSVLRITSGSYVAKERSGQLNIGNDATTGANTRGFYGILDDVRFYNRALTSDEIKHLYRPGIKETLGDPTVQYDFATVDISGSSYIEDQIGDSDGEINGTLNQLQSYTDYNGNSDYYSSSSELKITGAQTWCCEIYIESSGHSGGDTVYRIMSNKGSSSGFDLRVDTRSASDQLFFADYDLGSTAQTPSFTLFDQWTPIVVHVDGSGNMSLWYNGTEYTATGAEMSTPTEDFYINNVTPTGGTQRQLNARYRNIEIYSGVPSNAGTAWIPGDLTSLVGVTNVLALPKGSPE